AAPWSTREAAHPNSLVGSLARGARRRAEGPCFRICLAAIVVHMMQAFSRQAPVWVRVAVSATVLALYYTSFPWAYALLGADFVDLGALPVAAVAGCFGIAAGLLFVPVILVA